jgi:hypothetical protein
MPFRRALLALLVILCALFPLAGVAQAHKKPDKGPKVIASGLDNPRGIDIARDGDVYVAEAGRGGSGPCVGSPEEGGIVCAGASGAITKLSHRGQRRIASGLPSIAGEGTGSDATGPHDVELGRFGGAWFVVGLGADPSARSQLGPLGPRFGKLYFLSPWGGVHPAADIAGYEAANNPDGKVPDSNPYSVEDLGFSRVVADAGGNDLLKVSARGRISTLAVFPDRLVDFPEPDFAMEAVPTSVVEGPDGALYVGQLTGFPFPVGGANVYRVRPGHEPTVYASGFTNIVDIAFDKRGNLYVLEITKNGLLSEDPTGALIKVKRNGSQEEVTDDLFAPGGVAIDRDGDIYVTNHSTEAGTGEVLRIRGH